MRPVAERPAAQQGHAERRPARSAAALINISGGIGDFGALVVVAPTELTPAASGDLGITSAF